MVEVECSSDNPSTSRVVRANKGHDAVSPARDDSRGDRKRAFQLQDANFSIGTKGERGTTLAGSPIKVGLKDSHGRQKAPRQGGRQRLWEVGDEQTSPPPRMSRRSSEPSLKLSMATFLEPQTVSPDADTTASETDAAEANLRECGLLRH